ncbi:hypothetical protein SPBR_08933 [Sporothrix brasiliensis 5110]|uniref:FR47-like domain-containing protein n=1 Tax=Sporothrix brasiliensis 5110 TaxID=1398154 RepID=A0A0C2ENF1_9PEZI|nr:uncharacterized protein SPBR_08933 [Sporothrix brasiliensis 5110]KIH87624.1 hypothetical protein SPBR_08933 [Sporothrix brasiliensis 5110]
MVIEEIPVKPTQAQLRLLRAHLPYSLQVLRRLQVAAGAFDGINSNGLSGSGTSEYARVLFAYDGAQVPPEAEDDAVHTPFAAAFVDLSKARETATWIYASDQDQSLPAGADLYAADNDQPASWVVDRGAELVSAWSPARRARSRRLVLALLRRIRAIAQDVAPALAVRFPGRFGTEGTAADVVKNVKANIHDGIRYLLQSPGNAADDPDRTAIVLTYFDAFDKWLFRFEDVPVLSQPEDTELVTGIHEDVADGPDGARASLSWDRVRSHDDASLVISRTSIPRTVHTLLGVPSVALREKAATKGQDGTLQAWAFVGVDGSLWTLHTEPKYRGRGLAKTLAARLLRQYCGVFNATVDGQSGNGIADDAKGDGWCAADVSAKNRQSQAVCRRLGGKRAWATSWIVVSYDSLGDDG